MNKLEQANAYFRAGDYEQAATAYRDLLAEKPELGEALSFNLYLAENRSLPLASAPGDAQLVDPTAKYRLLNEQFTVDIIVPVYNALEDVKRCLYALEERTDGFHTRVIVVNDASEDDTTNWLRHFCQARSEQFLLVENEANKGYTGTVNVGLNISEADYVVTLNSDTIVSAGWLMCMVRAIRSDPHLGIVGPLSNAASWQNVPELYQDGAFAVNQLPVGLTVDDMAQIIRAASKRTYPRVPFVNGFCFMIGREVIDAIGILDEETFPTGYGEENDYCLRAAAAGFQLAVVDDAYVFHAKSKSFGHEMRKKLSKLGSDALKQKHGAEAVDTKAKSVRFLQSLHDVRDRTQRALQQWEDKQQRIYRTNRTSEPLRVLFCLPVSKASGGGVHSVVQETLGMRRLGVDAKIGVSRKHLPNFHAAYKDIQNVQELFIGVRADAWVKVAATYDVFIGTIFTSMNIVAEVARRAPRVLPAYYIQDYEPLFNDPKSVYAFEALRSYELVPEAILFAKTDWLRYMVLQEHGLYVHKVSPSVDHAVYKPDRQRLPAASNGTVTVSVSAMIRPKTPRRGALRTMQTLSFLKRELGDAVEMTIFGADSQDPFFQELTWKPFDYQNYGILHRPEVAQLLRQSDVFIDLSDYQAFGRTALEAMATGCVAVVPKWGGTDEYSWSPACHSVDPFSDTTAQEILEVLQEVRFDRSGRIRQQAAETARLYSVERAALSEISLLSMSRAKGLSTLG